MANERSLRRLHFAPAESRDAVAPDVQPQQNFAEVPPGSVRLERPAPRLQGGGFVRDRGESGFRQGPPALSSGWCTSLTRDYAADFQARAEHERMVRFMEALAGQEKARFRGVSNHQPPIGDSSWGLLARLFPGFAGA
jgi:hypothetical protein